MPDVPARAKSWAEWLYFKGRSGDVQFYMTFLVGPAMDGVDAVRACACSSIAAATLTSLFGVGAVDEASLLRDAPDLTIGGARVRLEGMRYHITFDLPRPGAGAGREPLATSSSTPLPVDRCRRSNCAGPAAGCRATRSR